MGYYSVWAYLAGMGAVFALAATPLLKWADTPPTTVQARIYTLDGLRGFLALAVVFHHGAIYRRYLLAGTWDPPPTRFYADLGPVGVAMFFMITGYLFWGQTLRVDGRLNLAKLYIGRFFRIMPLCAFLALVMLPIIGTLAGWHLSDPMAVRSHYAVQIRLLGGVTWTLRYEWAFYVSLALTSVFARTPIWGGLFPGLGIIIGSLALLRNPGDIPIAAVLMFSIGMAAAYAKQWLREIRIPQWAASCGALAGPVLVLWAFDSVYETVPILLLGASFFLVVFDATVFGLLLTKSATRLGNISYGIYLLQGPAFFLIFSVPALQALALTSPFGHWAVAILVALVLVLVATLTHVLIERPGIKAGQRLWASLRQADTPPKLQGAE
jgi:peptidoglycan/LPS O-acetylase OafA/YrhL